MEPILQANCHITGVGINCKYQALDEGWEGRPGLRSEALAHKQMSTLESGVYFLSVQYNLWSPQGNDHSCSLIHTLIHSQPLKQTNTCV